ncbi:MAG: HmuY family protein [Saprospiraceae bacterium]|nr:HmuY family protein [Saprospiraceae bacterium]
MKRFLLISLLINSLLFSFCKKDETGGTVAPIAQTITSLPADPGTGVDPSNGQPIGTTGKYTLFNFATASVVANTDSATNKWDIGFKGTAIIFNSGISGPGNAGVIIQDGILDDITTAPTIGYLQDNATSLAIPVGSGKGWYTYDGQAMVLRPTAGKILLVRTADNKYAKMEIISYYKDAPANPTFMIPARYFTFRYFYQGDGSVVLK